MCSVSSLIIFPNPVVSEIPRDSKSHFLSSDFVSGHWYGCPGGSCSVSDDVSSFQSYVTDLISTAAGRDVWVPEFQRFGDAGGQQEFLEAVLLWLDSSAVVRYAYFMVVDGILTTGGEVNALGGAYAGV